jgi:hypothetical protein
MTRRAISLIAVLEERPPLRRHPRRRPRCVHWAVQLWGVLLASVVAPAGIVLALVALGLI